MTTTWIDGIGEQIWAVVETIGSEARDRGILTLLRPIAPFNRPAFLAPAVTIGALLTFLALSGVAVTALGADLAAARQRAYRAVDRIDWPGGFCRRDIGWQAVARER